MNSSNSSEALDAGFCPLCGSVDVCKWGRVHLHTRKDVGGVSAELIYPEGLYRVAKCSNCGVAYKIPTPSESELGSLYAASPESTWGSNPDPVERRFNQLESIANEFSSGNRVLDFGCSTGALLGAWSSKWDKYGVEPSRSAGKLAKSRGLSVWASLDEIELSGYFDVVIMSDIIEHLPNTLRTMRSIRKLLRENGVVIILTGCTDFWFWKIAKGGYWYCDIPEHVIFFGKSSMNWLADAADFDLFSIARISHLNSGSWREYGKQILKNMLFIAMEKCRYGPLVPRAGSRTTYPNFHSAVDHMIVVMKSKA